MPAVAIASCQGKRFQHFELTTGGMLKVNDWNFTKDLAYKTHSYCLVVNPAGELQTMICALEQKFARNPWSFKARSDGSIRPKSAASKNEHLRREAIKPIFVHRIHKQWNGEGDTLRYFAKYVQGLTPPVEQPKMQSFIQNGTDDSM